MNCTQPDTPTVTAAPTSVCDGDMTTLTITGNLNSATAWVVYTDSCGGTQVGTTATSTIDVTPTSPSTIYYIRGEDGTATCIDESTATCADVTVTVNSLPAVTYTALADLCVDAGVQAGLGGGSPTGGVYSGTGITDDGNGMTYSFDPAAAGVGVHTITYSYTDTNSCSGSATDDVEVFALPTVTFTAPADLCLDGGVQAGLGGGAPTGGVYSGTGITDDGNGMTYSFDPAAAGVGVHTITYSYTDTNSCSGSATDDVEVFALPDASVDDTGVPTIVANATGVTYQWINCDTNMPIPSETNQSFTATENGNYAVDVTENGCTVRSSCVPINTLSVSEVTVEAEKFQIYPNPTSGIVYISSYVNSVSLYSITGQKVMETTQSTFNISTLESGVYFITIETKEGSNVIKRLVKR